LLSERSHSDRGAVTSNGMSYDIISIGSATRDVLLGVEDAKNVTSQDFPSGQALCLDLGGKVEIKKIVTTSGGGGTNTAVTFARQGLTTACIGVVGNDSNGEDVIKELQREGIDTQYFSKHSDDQTAYSVILVHPGGERTILSYKGEGQHFEVSQIPFEELDTKWLFLNSLGGHFEILEKAVTWASGKGIQIATNPGTKELQHGLEKLRPLLQNCAIVSMNQEEAGQLAGIDISQEDEIFKFMDEIVGGIFVMTKGPQGVVVSDGTQRYHAGVPDSPVVERTGAGDAFISAFVAEYMRSGDISKAIQLATANSSSVVTQYGAKAGILKAGDTGPWPLVEVSIQ